MQENAASWNIKDNCDKFHLSALFGQSKASTKDEMRAILSASSSAISLLLRSPNVVGSTFCERLFNSSANRAKFRKNLLNMLQNLENDLNSVSEISGFRLRIELIICDVISCFRCHVMCPRQLSELVKNLHFSGFSVISAS